jgi:hypothetical protein
VSRPVVCFRASRRYLLLALVAAAGAMLSVEGGLHWNAFWWISAAGFTITGAAILVLLSRPSIHIEDSHLRVGRRAIPWSEIRRLDQTGWNAPLAVHLTLDSGERLLLLYPGDVDSAAGLLRHLRRYCRHALLDGVPYRQFWGELPNPSGAQLGRYPLLRPEDEEEVERMFQRLKAAGRLDRHANDEK